MATDDSPGESEGTADPAEELAAMSAAAPVLQNLPPASRRRAIAWLGQLYDAPAARPTPAGSPRSGAHERSEGGESAPAEAAAFADLFDRLAPRSDGERVLAALYWLQVIQSKPTATSLDMNRLLNDLGHWVERIRLVLPELQTSRPALVVQVRHGGGQQGRRVVKLSAAGTRAIEAALAAGGFEHTE